MFFGKKFNSIFLKETINYIFFEYTSIIVLWASGQMLTAWPRQSPAAWPVTRTHAWCTLAEAIVHHTILSGVIRIRTFVFADVWNCVLFRCFGIYWLRFYWLGPLLKIKQICAWVVYSILCWFIKNNITISLKKCCCESVMYSQCV